jgi:hypothetical protein
MRAWGFRVGKKDDDFAIYYAYYDDDARLHALSESAISPAAEDLEGLYETLKLMFESFNKPPIDFATLKTLEKDETIVDDNFPSPIR